MTPQRIYLDHAATTPLAPEVAAAMRTISQSGALNPSSLHAEGRNARAILDDVRDRVAAVLGASRKEIVFTSGGSESDTLAIVGVARAQRQRGRHIVSTAIEHHAVLHALDALRDDGFEVTLIPVDAQGRVDERAYAHAFRDDTILASVMYANNEIGTIQPIKPFAALAHRRGVTFHTDAVQAAQYLSLDVRDLDVDLLALSAHKFCGPPGVGILYVKAGTPLAPQIFGGTQEYNRRAGTENVAAIAGMTLALERAREGVPARSAAVAALRDHLETAIVAAVPGAIINGYGADRLPNILSVTFPGTDVERLLVALDLAGIAVSAGSACTSGSLEPSHVITALGHPKPQALRFSLGSATTAAEIDTVAALIPTLIAP